MEFLDFTYILYMGLFLKKRLAKKMLHMREHEDTKELKNYDNKL